MLASAPPAQIQSRALHSYPLIPWTNYNLYKPTSQRQVSFPLVRVFPCSMSLKILYPSKDLRETEATKAEWAILNRRSWDVQTYSHLLYSIFAVHGLDGDPKDTWTSHQSDAFWLKDFLLHEVPNAWVMTFGFDTDAAFGKNHHRDSWSCKGFAEQPSWQARSEWRALSIFIKS